MTTGTQYLAGLVDPANPDRVIGEVLRLMRGTLGGEGLSRLPRIHRAVRGLFSGEWPDYLGCNTRYHDLEHTSDTFLAMARLIHGAGAHRLYISPRTALLGLVSALLHDTGYIQRKDDLAGTGAKYTANHIFRSIDFARGYLLENGFTAADVEICRKALLCTGFDTQLEEVDFRTIGEKMIGKMLGTADLVGQMASSRYLGKLPHLYREFVEAGLVKVDEYAFLAGTGAFYESVRLRLDGEFGGVHRYLRDHFRTDRGIDRDLYREAIEENVSHLLAVLREHPTDYRDRLDRPFPGPVHALPPGSGERHGAAPPSPGPLVLPA